MSKPVDGELTTDCFCEPFELTFKNPNPAKKFTPISIMNPDKETEIIFKFKCNATKHFQVKPVYGYVKPGLATAILFTASPLKKEMAAINHRVSVCIAAKTADMPKDNAKECWNKNKPWAPKQNAIITVPIRYQDGKNFIGGFTDEQRAKVIADYQEKYALIGGVQKMQGMHKKAATICIDEEADEGDKQAANRDVDQDMESRKAFFKSPEAGKAAPAPAKPSGGCALKPIDPNKEAYCGNFKGQKSYFVGDSPFDDDDDKPSAPDASKPAFIPGGEVAMGGGKGAQQSQFIG